MTRNIIPASPNPITSNFIVFFTFPLPCSRTVIIPFCRSAIIRKRSCPKSSFFHLYVVICRFMTYLLCIKIFCVSGSFVSLCTHLLEMPFGTFQNIPRGIPVCRSASIRKNPKCRFLQFWVLAKARWVTAASLSVFRCNMAAWHPIGNVENPSKKCRFKIAGYRTPQEF